MRRSELRFRVISVAVAAALAGVTYLALTPSSDPLLPSTPAISAPAETSAVSPTTPVEVPVTPEPTVDPTTKKAVVIKDSKPVELYFPRLKKHVLLDGKICPVTYDENGKPMLDPDRSDYTKACYFVSPDYASELPGTNAPDVSIFAGHTWRNGAAAFNILYDWKKGQFLVRAGDEVWVKTIASGKRWLVYKATDTLKTAKYAAKGKVTLMNDPAVWGTKPTPGVLITVGCLQPKNTNLHSSENIVIKWKFARVQG